MRLPYAAKQLIKQVKDEKPKASYESYGDPDGLGVYRTIKFDKTTSKWLAPLLMEIQDPRIESAEVTDAGYLHVTFSPTRTADFKTSFPLAEAYAVWKDKKQPPGKPDTSQSSQ